MPIEFECPACSKSLRIANRKAGFEVRCPNCEIPCVVPAENAVASTEDIEGEAIKAHPETSDKHSRDDGVPIHRSKKSDKADSIIGMLVLIGLPIFIVVLAHTSGRIRGSGANDPTRYTSSTTTYKERVPMVGITVRHSYKCSQCGRKSFKDVYNEHEV